MGEIYKILTIMQGEPPKPTDSFTWEYYTAKGEYKKWTGTPLEFYKVYIHTYSIIVRWHGLRALTIIGVNQAFGDKQYPLLEAFSLINDPRNEYGKLYTVEKLGNVWNGVPIRCKLSSPATLNGVLST